MWCAVNIVNAAFILYYYSIETKKKIHQPSMLVQHLDVLKEIRSIRKDEDKSTENYSQKAAKKRICLKIFTHAFSDCTIFHVMIEMY